VWESLEQVFADQWTVTGQQRVISVFLTVSLYSRCSNCSGVCVCVL